MRNKKNKNKNNNPHQKNSTSTLGRKLKFGMCAYYRRQLQQRQKHGEIPRDNHEISRGEDIFMQKIKGFDYKMAKLGR